MARPRLAEDIPDAIAAAVVRLRVLGAAALLALVPLGAGPLANPSLTGRWTPFSLPIGHEPIHLMLLRGGIGHHSRILSWGYTPYSSPEHARLWGWNPASGPEADCSTFPLSSLETMPLATSGMSNLYCAGHSVLPDGRLLISGGHDEANSVGLRQSTIFDPSSPTATQWQPQPAMEMERWYPTNTTLGDGSVLSTAGTRFMQAILFGGTPSPEDPAAPAQGSLRSLGLTTTGRWLPESNAGYTGPGAVEGHTAIWSDDWREMVVFGGRNGSGGPTARTWRCRLEVRDDERYFHWREITVPGPAARSRHSAVVRPVGAEDHMVVFGGLDANGQPRADLHDLVWPTTGWAWSQLTDLNSPGPRYGHAAVYDQARDRMLVFGGLAAPGTLADNDVWSLSFSNMTWTRIVLPGRPEAREGHSLLLDPSPRPGPFSSADRRAILFGGASGSFRNDVWVLWISGVNGAMEWQALGRLSGAPRGGLSRHAAVWDETQLGTGMDRMVVIGGQNAAGAVAGAWTLDANLTAWMPMSPPAAGLAGATATFYGAGVVANYPEVFTPSVSGQGVGSWRTLDAPRWQQTYPFMFLLPSGNVLCAGPDPNATVIDPHSQSPAWLPIGGPSAVGGAAAVMYEPGKVMKCGSQVNPTNGITTKIEIDAFDNTAGWVTLSSTMKPRTYHNLTMLPDGKVLLTGGLENAGNAFNMANPAVHEPEIWDPATGTWSGLGVLAPDPARRGYHSTIILLPDGRLLSAGGEPGISWMNPDYELATVFCPPYLFNPDGSAAARPRITSGYKGIGYGGLFSIGTNDKPISSVCLIKASTVTHAFNQDQRYIRLAFTADYPRKRLLVHSPADPNQAPPGDYLLFINKRNPLTGHEVPSIAWWVRIQDGVWLDAEPGAAPPARFALEQNRPNPAGPSTSIGFALPAPANVTFEVFDLAGRRIHARGLGVVPSGRHRIEWTRADQEGRPVPAGIYMYQITAGALRERRKMVLLGR